MTSAIQIDASKVFLRIEVQVRGVQGSSVDDGSLPPKGRVNRRSEGCEIAPVNANVCLSSVCVRKESWSKPQSHFPLQNKTWCPWWITGFSWLCIPNTKCKGPRRPPTERGLSRQESAARCCTAQSIFVTDISWFPHTIPESSLNCYHQIQQIHQIKGQVRALSQSIPIHPEFRENLSNGFCRDVSDVSLLNCHHFLVQPILLRLVPWPLGQSHAHRDAGSHGDMTARLLPGTSEGKKYQRDFYQAKVACKKKTRHKLVTLSWMLGKTQGLEPDLGTKTWRMVCHIMTRDLSTPSIPIISIFFLSTCVFFGCVENQGTKRWFFWGGVKSARKMPPKKTNISPRLFFSNGNLLVSSGFRWVYVLQKKHPMLAKTPTAASDQNRWKLLQLQTKLAGNHRESC